MTMFSLFLRLADPSRISAFRKRLLFAHSATCGEMLKVTHRADIFVHGADRANIRIGRAATIDGTVEVYEKGVLAIGDFFFLGRSRVFCSSSIEIGSHVLVSDGVAIMDSDLHPSSAEGRRRVAHIWADGRFPNVYEGIESAPVKICDDVWIGFGACVLKGVTVGQGAIVGAGSVVTKDVPPWTVVAGNPARIIRELGENER